MEVVIRVDDPKYRAWANLCAIEGVGGDDIFRVVSFRAEGGGKKPYPAATLVLNDRKYITVDLGTLRTGGVAVASDTLNVAADDTVEVRPDALSNEQFDRGTTFFLVLQKLTEKEIKESNASYSKHIDPR